MSKLLIAAGVLCIGAIAAYGSGYRVIDTHEGYVVLNASESCVYETLIYTMIGESEVDESNPYASFAKGKIADIAKKVGAYEKAGFLDSDGGLLMGGDNSFSHCFN